MPVLVFFARRGAIPAFHPTRTKVRRVGSPVVWFEIHAVDVDRARDFYGMLFGWRFSALEEGREEYWLVSTTEGTISGGLTRMTEGTPGDSTLLYVQVENLAGTLESATVLGGVVEQGPTLITNEAGSYALVRDPNGALLGLWSQEPA